MASPVGRPNLLSGNSSKVMNSGDGSDKKMGFKQNRSMNLFVAQSPLFMMPPGLSPSGLLNSPGFFSPLQVCRDHLRLEILRSQELMPGPLTNCKRWCIQGTYDLTFPFEAGSRISCKQAYLE